MSININNSNMRLRTKVFPLSVRPQSYEVSVKGVCHVSKLLSHSLVRGDFRPFNMKDGTTDLPNADHSISIYIYLAMQIYK